MRQVAHLSSVLLLTTIITACPNKGGGPGTPGYRLSGTITGLPPSATLMLSNGASPNRAITVSGGAITFQFRLHRDKTYNVTVAQQPAGLICTVSNGRGVMTGDVSNISVSCLPTTAPAYALTGKISGLNSLGLILAENSSGFNNTVSLNSGATHFGFQNGSADYLLFGSPYNVTVQQQPAGSICTVSHGGGIISNRDINTILVNCSPTKAALYTLGGKISGLNSTGLLVLADGSSASSTVSVAKEAKNFYFQGNNNYLPQGARYDITVQKQPAGLTCTVNNGNGVTLNTNTNNVEVNCEPMVMPAYTLGGTISGLNRSGLTLADGSSALSTMSIDTEAKNFRFHRDSRYLLTGSVYQVTVQKQPPGLICTVNNGNGIITDKNVEDVAITCLPKPYG